MNNGILEFARQRGIIAGVCGVERMDYLIPILSAARTPFVNKDIERRINPRVIMPEARSVVVIGVPCGKTCEKPEDFVMRCRVASIGVGEDYHVKVKRILGELAEFLGLELGSNCKAFVDSGHLVERALAVKAGLGFIGKNGFVISEKFGSFFTIGYLLTDLQLAPSEPRGRLCGNCRKCLESCTALSEGEVICDVESCTAYINQAVDISGLDTKKISSGWIYGCDVCQSVCPYNQYELEECDPEEMYPRLDSILDMDGAEFEKTYGSRSLFWRGLDIIKRNAGIAAAEFGKTKEEG